MGGVDSISRPSTLHDMADKSKSKKRPAAPAPPPAKKLPIAWILGGAVGLALVVAIAIGLSEETAGAAVEIGSPTVSGDALPLFSADGADAAVGMQMPAVVGTDFDGQEVVIGPGNGPAAIVFLAHWCGLCQNEVPAIQGWLDGGATPAAPIYSVATGIDKARPNYPPWSWLEREGWTSPLLVDDAAQSIMRAFGGSGFPFWVFINEDGEVIGRVAGDIGVSGLQTALQLAVSR
jgi:hypothetical protein